MEVYKMFQDYKFEIINLEIEYQELLNLKTNAVRIRYSAESIGNLIFICLSQLPSSDLLKHATTDDLKVEWNEQRNNAFLEGLVLRSKFCGGGNPALKAKLEGHLNDYNYEVIMARLDWYKSIFNVIQSGWEYLELEFNNFSKEHQIVNELPACDIDLYSIILTEIYNSRFISCVNGFKYSIQDEEKRARTTADIYRKAIKIECGNKLIVLDDEDKKTLNTLRIVDNSEKLTNANTWLHTSIAIISKAASVNKDEAISKICREYYRKLNHLCDIHANVLMHNRKKKLGIHKTIKWDNGIKKTGVKGGFS